MSQQTCDNTTFSSIVAPAAQREARREILISSEDSCCQSLQGLTRQILLVFVEFIVVRTKHLIPCQILQAEEYWTMLHHRQCEIANVLRVAVFADD